MAAETPDAEEDALLEWIEAAQPVSSLCEISLAAQRGDESSPPASGGAAEQHAATGKRRANAATTAAAVARAPPGRADSHGGRTCARARARARALTHPQQ